MSDRRIGLLGGTELVMSDGRHITIHKEIGRGASCIVYDAYYGDNIFSNHSVRIKECYPIYVELARDKSGALLLTENETERFEEAKERFKLAYQKNAKIKEIVELANSTSNVNEIYEYNGTLYSMMAYDEGTDYSKHEDLSLKEVCEHVKSIAIVIQKYHVNGYLHLDIKPENIFVIPETSEHVLLFDFDSITTIQELKENLCYRLSFSDGFSAPELIRGSIRQIGTQTDLYSLGALLFYKIFGRTPTLREGSLGTNFDFSVMRFSDDRYPPKLYKELTRIFQKTLATSTTSRWKDVTTFIDSLNSIIELSDLERIYLRGSFTYNTKTFVGRNDELLDIHARLAGSNALFLSGIGGIGKTEIAKRYAYINQQCYDNIVFLPFTDSLEETFCSNELYINTLEQGDEESTSEYFERKLIALRQMVTSRDLIIIDNFDVANDVNLPRVLDTCKCKFLITTREDYDDYYPQIKINRMKAFDDIRAVFEAYNPVGYSEEKKACVNNIIELVERHTMTVELFAKYLRDAEKEPEELFQKLMEKEGVTNVGETSVKHRKDRKLRVDNINGHLLALFDLSGFSKLEEELIKSLALLGYIKIKKARFFELFTPEGNKDALQKLIKLGWVEYDAITKKISLHQIILDLVLNHLKPTSSACPNIVAAMLIYLNNKPVNNVAWDIRKKLLNAFMERIIGDDVPYAKLCIAYKKPKYLNTAEKICESSSELDAKDVLQHICRMRLKEISKCDGAYFMLMNEEHYNGDKITQISEMAERAIHYAEEFSSNSSFRGVFYAELGKDLENIATDSGYELWFGQDESNAMLDFLYGHVAKLYDAAEVEIMQSDLSNQEKERYIKQIQKFYLDDDFCAPYRCNHFSDIEKVVYYQKKLDELKKNTFGASPNSSVYMEGETMPIYLDDLTYSDMAQQEAQRGNYEKAIEYYCIAIDKGQELYDIGYSYMADYYAKLGELDKAKECLITVLEYDKEQMLERSPYSSYTSHVCYQLIMLYWSEKKYDEAALYAKELIYYNLEEIQENYNAYYLKWIVVANHILYAISSDSRMKEMYWKECVHYFQMIDEKEELAEELIPFLLEYIYRIEDTNQKIRKAYEFFERCDRGILDDSKVDFLNYIFKLCNKDRSRINDLVIVCTRYSSYYRDCVPGNYEKALKYALQAKKLIEEEGIKDEYCQSLVYKELGECYFYLTGYEYEQAIETKSHCNYYLIATKEGENKPVEVRIKLLQEAADAYGYVDNYKMQKQCLLEGISLLQLVNCTYESDILSLNMRLSENLLSCCVKLCDVETLKEHANRMLHIIIDKCFESIKRNEQYDSYDYCGQIKNVAYNLGQGNCICESVFCYLIAIILGIYPNMNQEILCKADIFDGLTKEITLELHKALHSEISDRGIDLVIDVYGNIVKPLQDDEYGGIEQEFLWFLEQYQNQDIEFKRK